MMTNFIKNVASKHFVDGIEEALAFLLIDCLCPLLGGDGHHLALVTLDAVQHLCEVPATAKMI